MGISSDRMREISMEVSAKRDPQELLRYELNRFFVNYLEDNIKSLEEELKKITKYLEENNKSYKKLLMDSDFKKEELLKMFKNNDIYADKNRDAIINIKYKDKVIGGYKLNLQDGEIKLLENSIKDEKALKLEENIKSSLDLDIEIE